MDEPDKAWKRLVDAARAAPAEAAPEHRAPDGFAARLVGLRDRIIALARTLLWRRWSLVAALLAAVVYLGVLLVARCDRGPILEPPDDPITEPTRR